MSDRSKASHPVRAAAAVPLLAILGSVVLGGCGNLTAGGIGEASVSMSGDAPDSGPSPQATGPQTISPQMGVVSGPSSSSTTLVDPALVEGESPEGEVEAELSVFLVAEDGTATALTDGDVRVRVDLLGVQEPEIGSRRVSAGSYTALRMVFTEIEAEVDAGLVIGGVEVTGLIDVEIEDTNLVVERSLDLEIPDGGQAELLIDLNSESWLQAVDPLTKTVDAQVFADLVTVVVR